MSARLEADGEVLENVAALDDHEGTLTVRWKERPTEQRKRGTLYQGLEQRNRRWKRYG